MQPSTILRILAVAFVLLLTGCGTTSDTGESTGAELDGAGMTQDEALSLELSQQYELAGQRYEATGELMGEVQQALHDGPWQDLSGGLEYYPSPAQSVGRAPTGATKDNSYYFRLARTLPVEDGSMMAVLRETREAWLAKGWDVEGGETQTSTGRLAATTPEGYWVALQDFSDDGMELDLSIHSPVYWGEQYALGTRASQGRTAQDEAGMTWDTTDRDPETLRATRQPGEYRPFPSWEMTH